MKTETTAKESIAKESTESVKSSLKEKVAKCGVNMSSEVRPSHLGL